MDPILLLAFPLLLALSTPCSACHCKIQHPQVYYCMSDIVIRADVLGPGNNTVLKRSFKVSVTKIFKAPRGITQIHQIYTPKDQKDCGYELETTQQSQLLIAGYLRMGRVVFTRCHLAYLWQNLTREQITGFETAFRTGCKCQVRPCLLCSVGCPEPDVTECVWKQTDCNYDNWKRDRYTRSMCAPSASGRCEWINIKTHQNSAPTTISMTTPTVSH